MARNKLTDTRVRAEKKPGKHGDGEGLYLYVGPVPKSPDAKQRKSWVFVYIRNGNRREMGLGAYSGTEAVTLATARVKADEVRAILARGGDPFTEMEERRQAVERKTFGQCADDMLISMEGTWRNAKHEAQWKMTLGDTYCSTLRGMPVDDVDTADVVAVLEPHWRTKHETASRLRGRIERVLDYAKAKRYRTGENPARWKGHIALHLPKPSAEIRMKRGHHAALPFTDAPEFMTKLRSHRGTGALALEFAIVTAARTGEVTGATWDEIDEKAMVWTVPAVRMKAGREHRVPLTASAMTILKQQREHQLDEWVFPGQKHGRPISDAMLTKALKLAGGGAYTVHGMRSAFRDWVHEATNFPGDLAEAALAHLVGDETERAYRRSDALEKRRKLMTAWDSYLSAKAASVVAFPIVKGEVATKN